MDEFERLENENEVANVEVAGESSDEPMTLDDALAQARSEIASREEANEVPEESSESAGEQAVPEQETTPEQPMTAVPEQTGVNEAKMLRQQLSKQNQMLAQYQSQLEQQARQLAMMQQQTQQNTSEAVQNVTQAMMKPPVIDFSSIMYASEDEQRAAMEKFVNDTMAYTRGSVMKELQPLLTDFREREAAVERNNVKEGYRHNDGYAGFAEREAWIEQLLEKNPELRNLPLGKQYEIGYLITKGVDAVKAARTPAPEPTPKTVDERLAEIEGDAELMRALEAKRVRGIAQSQKDAPPSFVAGGGANRVGLNVPDEPTDFDMARDGALNFLRGRR